MTRIVAGSARGRRLVVPAGVATRPTSSRAREALFSSLEAEVGPWSGLGFLDLYAGSGAVGLEAASRGAAPVVLVESERPAWHAARENVADLGLAGVVLHREPVEVFLAHPSGTRFAVVFLDPPYAMDDEEVGVALAALVEHSWLAPQAVVVVERATRGAGPRWPPGLAASRSRRYGDATLWYGRGDGA